MYISDDTVTYLGRTNARQPYRKFGIKRKDRLSHMYIIGRTGTGKSTLLGNMIRQDIANGEGLTLLDPHGDLVESIAANIPEHRKENFIYFNETKWDQPYGYNPLKHIAKERRPLAASGMMEVFQKLWGEKVWGQRMEYILRNALLALLDQPEANLTHIQRLLTDKTFRENVACKVAHPPVRDFWQKEFKGYSHRYRAEAIAPIQSKIGAFLADPRLYKILIEPDHPPINSFHNGSRKSPPRQSKRRPDRHRQRRPPRRPADHNNRLSGHESRRYAATSTSASLAVSR